MAYLSAKNTKKVTDISSLLVGTRTEAFCTNCDNLVGITLKIFFDKHIFWDKMLFFIANSRKINGLALPNQWFGFTSESIVKLLYIKLSFNVKETKKSRNTQLRLILD